MKTIMITGATDGIGLATAQTLAKQGHNLFIHGRNASKLAAVKSNLEDLHNNIQITTFCADLSTMNAVKALADEILTTLESGQYQLTALINNAGVFKVTDTTTADNLDVRFMVNTIAPFLLTKSLLPVMNQNSRVINLSSAAQQSVEPHELLPKEQAQKNAFSDNQAYAKSKLAITMWSRHMAMQSQSPQPSIIAVNPASLLASKMVKDAYGVQGGDLQIGADILVKAALSDEFANANGLYFDNDSGRFTQPHPDALNEAKNAAIVEAIEQIISAKH